MENGDTPKNILDEEKKLQLYVVVLSFFTETSIFLSTSFPFSSVALFIQAI